MNMPNTDSIISKQCHTTGAVIKFGLSGTDGVFSFADSTAGSCDSTIFPYDYGYWGLRLAKDSLVFKGKKTEYRSMRLVSISKDSLLVNYADSASVPHIVKTITFIKQ
ncbi:hypothetical protein FLA_3668 [Filimonas lacunae]|nr:hypothetical protein FLA_3668 [Filimonas lacunae]